MIPGRRNAFTPVICWVFLCAVLSAAGWILSYFHALNRIGYSLVFALAVTAYAVYQKRLGAAVWPQCNGGRFRKRFSRFFPGAFLFVTLLAALGGVLHPPSNYDALAYRVPRILQWLSAEQWHWIHTGFGRLNTRATGHEWIGAPLVLFLKTDRWLFLINVASILLLPSLVFSLYTRLGVSARVAWRWMWLLPTAYSFVLQVGGIGNDLYGAVFALAAVDLALRARSSGRFLEAAASCLAVALLSNSKTSNLPLALPWLIAILPSFKLALRRPIATAAVAALALFCSFLPTAVMNHTHLKDWTGAKAEGLPLDSYDWRITIPGNVLVLTAQNFAPPIFPIANKWNALAPRLMPPKFHAEMLKNFEPSGANLGLTELQNEEFSGFGFGLSCLTVISLLAGWRAGRGQIPSRPGTHATLVCWAPWASLLVYMAKAGIGTAARIITPYYLLLMPLLLRGRGQRVICTKRWWNALAAGVFGLAAILIVVTPSRPLWPANTILSWLVNRHPENATLLRAQTVFSVYGKRADALAPLRAVLPPNEPVMGLVTFDDPETSLWRPFGSRRFEHVLVNDTREEILAKGIRCIAVNAEYASAQTDFKAWLEKVGGHIEQTVAVRYRAARGPFDWHIVRLMPDAPVSSPGKQ